MIDFSKKIKREEAVKKTNPLELYNDLDRSSTTGPLRPVQEYILQEWFTKKYNDKDLIVKLHTGEGKTLIGLLMLQSKINAEEGTCVYVCPNKFLADQAFFEAKKFGIKVCIFDEDNNFPNEFLEGKSILLTHVQKIFNGKTIFGLDNSYIKINSIVIDDAHACLDSIKQAFTVTIKRKEQNELYNQILELFENDLIDQGEGTFIDIKENGDYESIMMIPYWAWINKKTEVTEIMAKKSDENFLKFVWPLIRDEIEKCDAYFNGREIQIVPHAFNVDRFSSFTKAKQRVLMSATTQDDIFFVKNLNFSIEAINSPLQNIERKWSGEKMIIIPSEIRDTLNREKIIEFICRFNWKQFGVCALVPNWQKQGDYERFYCTLLNTNNIFKEVTDRQDGKYGKTLVLANRYDGIDLPDDACRILILDSLPFFANMSDTYEERGRIDCELIKRKIAQKIEQGLGRSVRGEKDYCCVIIIGADLVKFIRSTETKKYFSKQTRKQIEIGLAIAKMFETEDTNEEDTKILLDLIKQSVNRDDGWKEYYRSEMNQIEMDENINIRKTLLAEKRADDYFIKNQYDKAAAVLKE